MTTRYGPRPRLGELRPGQTVMVRRSSNDSRRRNPEDLYIPATVVKASRVWVDLEGTEGDWKRTWRMRRDTQDQGTQYPGSNASFATMEQHEWGETRRWAMGYLREQGLIVDRDSPWRDREIELADIISAAMQEGGRDR